LSCVMFLLFSHCYYFSCIDVVVHCTLVLLLFACWCCYCSCVDVVIFICCVVVHLTLMLLFISHGVVVFLPSEG
jgi:hypothetical protein